jgi:hypothetical protein
MRYDKLKNATRITMSSDEADMVRASLLATESIPITSLNAGLIERLLKLASSILENRNDVPDTMFAEARIVDMLLGMGMEDDKNAAVSKRSKEKPEGSSSESRIAPLPGTSI